MTFPEGQEAGWHVLIGDNGSGKSTIVRSVALALLDYEDINATRQSWDDWLKKGQQSGNITLDVLPQKGYDSESQEVVTNKVSLKKDTNKPRNVEIDEVIFRGSIRYNSIKTESISENNASYKRRYFIKNAWFSAGYGPFRRFTGGDRQKEEDLERSNPKLAAHLSIFGEDIALSGALNYLRELYLSSLDTEDESSSIAEFELMMLSDFINLSNLLPNNTKIGRVNKDGIFLKDGNGTTISVLQMSDGYRSILSLVIDLLRHLIRAYNIHDIYDSYNKDKKIDFPGVVLIDEVDAHLHPTWQTNIGQWFTKYFPNLQFIVTTHSPLVCRAAEKGSIWQLPAPGSDDVAHEITGDEKKRLVYGNVLDAYGTNAFGDNVARSESANDKLNELAELNIKSIMGQISPDEEKQLNALRSIFPTQG